MDKLKCSEPQCPEYVEYTPEKIPGLLLITAGQDEEFDYVYLTCPEGHTHKYKVRRQ
jgi:hypothetical protein